MSSVEAAASLFGAADTASDPFSAFVADDEPTAGPETHSDPFAHPAHHDTGAQPDASDLFGSSEAAQDYGDVQNYGEYDWTHAQSGATESHVEGLPAASYAQADYGNTGYYQDYQANGNTTAQQYSYEQPQQEYHGNDGYNSSSSYYTPAAPADPYANANYGSSTTSAYDRGAPAQNTPATTHSAYDPYAPATHTPANGHPTYAPAAPPAQSAYDPYNPIRSGASPAQPASYYSQPSTPSYSAQSSYTPYGAAPQATSALPPPVPVKAAPTADAYRPQKPNAYDPPIPAPKKAPKRYATAGPPLASPVVAQPLSPPPRTPSVPVYSPTGALGGGTHYPTYAPPAKTSASPDLYAPPPARASDGAVSPPSQWHASGVHARGHGGPASPEKVSPLSGPQGYHSPPPGARSLRSPPNGHLPPATGNFSSPVVSAAPPAPRAFSPPGPGHAHSGTPNGHHVHSDVEYDPEEFRGGDDVEGGHLSSPHEHDLTESRYGSPPYHPSAHGPLAHGALDQGPRPASGDHSPVGLQNYYGPQKTTSHEVAGVSPSSDRAKSPGASSVLSGGDPQSRRGSLNLNRTATPPYGSPYAAPTHGSYDPPSERTKSPGSVSTHSRTGSLRNFSEVRDSAHPIQDLTATVKPVSPRDLYSPPASAVVQRTKSPGASSVRSWAGSQRSSLDKPRSPASRAPSPLHAATTFSDTYNDAYSPQTARPQASAFTGTERAASPASMTNSLNGSAVYDPYAPRTASQSTILPNRTSSNGSLLSVASGIITDPYAPNGRSRQQASDLSFSSDTSSTYGYPDDPPSRKSTYDYSQEVTLSPPNHAAYAPSPTLMGANDPLGRVAARAPVASFGFGGKLITCFHGSGSLNTGFDVALSARQTTDVKIRDLRQLIPESALDVSESTFPGPLLNDPGTPTAANLVRTNAAQTKAKKALVLKYLDDRADELTRGLGYLHEGSPQKRQSESKIVLIRVLKLMVEHDGHLSGSAQLDSAVRAALVPRLANTAGEGEGDHAELPVRGYPGFGLPASDVKDVPIATYSVTPSALDKITEFLVRGDRKKAYHFALDEKMWAHAMVIASSIDKDAWKEVVNEFVRAELGARPEGQRLGFPPRDAPSLAGSGREHLRVAYNFFAGQGAAAVQELAPPQSLLQPNGLKLPSAASHVTPMSPSFPQPTLKISEDALAKWQETAAMIISNPITSDATAALIALGDFLASHQWVEAAHVCYLLSGQASLIGGARSPSVRVILIGSASTQATSICHRDPDPIIFSEIVEFALSLAPPVKGQDSFTGLPHLQAYKLIRAYSLAEVGQIKLASRYCEAIAGCLSRPSPYLHGEFAEQLKTFSERFVGAPQLDKSSWIGGKMTKPSLDGIGSWIGGRLTGFIAGEGESPSPPPEEPHQPPKANYVGPFSHYSTITSAAPSNAPSPNPSFTNLNTLSSSQPPRRTGSAAAMRVNGYAPVERASSAMDVRHRASPVSYGYVGPASATVPTFGRNSVFDQPAGYPGSAADSAHRDSDSTAQRGSVDGTETQESSWWGSSTVPTPTATNFVQVDNFAPPSSDGFISLMDDTGFDVRASPAPISRSHEELEDDDDDLGLGNARSRATRQSKSGEDTVQASPTESKEASQEQEKETRPDAKPTTAASGSGSWFGRLWKRSDTPATPGPVKANLGEEKTFYYDKELKRWVNKNVGEDAAKATPPPPPPSRPQSVSPASNNTMPATGTATGPAPARPASAFDLSAPPKGSSPRVRSNLVPSGAESAPPTPAASASLSVPPPPSRPRSQASKRNVRSRYVDVFQPEVSQ